MSYPFTEWSLDYVKTTLRMKRGRGWIGPLPSTRCALDWWDRERSKEEVEVERTEEYRKAHSLRWRLSWRGRRFIALEKHLVMQALSEAGVTKLTQRRVRRYLFSKEEKTSAWYQLREEQRKLEIDFANLRLKNEMATRQYKTDLIDKEIAKKNLFKTRQWGWLIDSVENLPQGQVFCVTVPDDLHASQMSNMVRSVLLMAKKTRMTRWSVKRSQDAKELYVCKVGSWSMEAEPGQAPGWSMRQVS